MKFSYFTHNHFKMSYFSRIGLLAVMLTYGAQCLCAQKSTSPVSAAVATAWAELTVRTMTKALKNTPTYGSRALGYLGLTMYESVVVSSKSNHSIARQLCDTLILPKLDRKKRFSPELSLNAGQSFMMRAMFGYTNRMYHVDSLTAAIRAQYAARYPSDVVERSEAYGRAVAEKIYQWSLKDGGHEAFDQNFPASYIVPTGLGFWTPPLVGQTDSKIPMHPYWGSNRTFIIADNNPEIPLPVPYSMDSTSAFFALHQEVYNRNERLSEEDREIVMWWGDDPNQTCSPPGHSYHLATLAIQKANPDLVKAAQTYCRVGMAVADAFVVCWKAKFKYMLERPSTYIRAHVEKKDPALHPVMRMPWLPFFPEPPFPGFYSGHATQSGAMATVLTDLYGENFAFTDDTHVGRLPLGYIYKGKYGTVQFKPRSFTSFRAAAQECAESRLMGGIHTRSDNEVGLVEGTKIGQHINRLRW